MSVKKKGPTTSGERGPNIESSMHAVVQVVALQQGMFGGAQPAWTGSGTIVHPSGIILTNCHVANPRAMGMSAPEANALAIAITQSADAAPKISYLADIVTYSAELDLAILRVTSTADGRRVSNLNLPFLPVGDSDALDLGDKLFIMGYPGIGGNTITFTTGAVSGFTSEEGIRSPRAWIKTDATIAGGNSGGTALNASGQLVGVPTQAAAGANI
ncbi:MAG TPA: serine protease, partial [Anaerolineales bacterium]|nr:serine protease [Anaerolineales bacterium]